MDHDVQHAVLHCMGTAIHLTMCGVDRAHAASARSRAEAAFRRLDDIFSRFRPDSELARLNMHSGRWNSISKPMADVVARMLELAQETQGLLDPSIGGYLAAEGYGLPHEHRVPSPAPDWRAIDLDNAGLRLRCAPGQVLEPAAIVKGMAIDDAGRVMTDVPAWMINAGGDILTRGDWPGQGHWNVAIRSPFRADAIVATVRLHNEAIATSGDYEVRHDDGWHHQIDAHTGMPTRDLVSASVIAHSAEHADTLASILFLAGSEHGPRRMEQYRVPFMCMNHVGQRFANAAFDERLVTI